ncbi:MAG: xanthine dehydrogenase family protein molybdopterin-binding subunit [Geothrix sp.]|nr:xanthine dehydrogenase family protein molybdopterin-binding subunit [Geothrix sp.]
MIGASSSRKEGRAKVTGTACYADDKFLPGAIHGVTVRSQVPRGILMGIHFGEGIPWDEFTIVTAADIPGQNRVASVVHDQPFLVGIGEEITHMEQPVALLAHPDRRLAEKARKAVRLDVEERPAILDLQASLDLEQVIYGTHNLLKEIWIQKGDPEPVWAQAAHVIEGEYRTGAQEQMYLETNAMVAMVEREAAGIRVTVWGSLQCPYYVHGALKQLFGLPDDRVRVVAMEMGGAFGGKEDYPSVNGGHAALLAWKSGRPVKLIYDREEDLACTTKRHPSRTRLRTAFDAEGRLLAMEVDFVIDGGAYATMSPVVLSRGALHAAGVYRCPHVKVHARAAATNTPPHGAFRGFGAPQSLFALERHMDVCARRMGLSAVELRRKNFLRLGDTMATGQVIREDLDLGGLMDRALERIGYHDKRAAFAITNPGDDPIKRGVGFSVFMHGCGFTGSGETHLASVAGVEGLADGTVSVLAASTEMGQGKNTVFAQIVAEALQLPYEMVDVAEVDTDRVPNSGPTVASRSTMVVGRILEDAAMGFKQSLVQQKFLKEPYTADAFREAVRGAVAALGSVKCYGQYHRPPHIAWDDATYRGDAYPTYAWACYAAEVRVDTDTYEVKVEDFAAVQEVGRVVNPVLAAGQIEGGVAQGIGWGLWEEVTTRQGRMINNQMTNYIIPTSADLPRIQVVFVENAHPAGPGGAKGLGELPMDGPAPALLNALENALGPLRLDEVPMTPDRLLERCEEAPHG